MTHKHNRRMHPQKIGNELLHPAVEPETKKKVDEGPLPLGDLFTEKDRDFFKYKRGFSF